MTDAALDDVTLLEHHFDDLDQQHDAATLGTWVFLAGEVLFFGGLFTAYSVYREQFPAAFSAGGRHLNVLLGTINTVVLLTSSLTMALAVRAAQQHRNRELVRFLLVTMLLGTAFLVIKGVEYVEEYHEHLVPALNFAFDGKGARQVELYFYLYFFMTGLHAVHLLIGIGLVGVMAWLSWRRWLSGGGATQVEVAGLYWHFIDIVWVFLFPLLYLIDVHK